MNEIKPSEAPVTESCMPGHAPPAYEDIVEAYSLTLLADGGDFSIEDGDLAMTKDGDIRICDLRRMRNPHS